MTKKCSSCKIDKALDCFHRHPTATLGRKPVCKECVARYSKQVYRAKMDVLGKKPMVIVGGTVKECLHKKGDTRDDGMIFWSKRKNPNGFQEWWVTKSHYDDLVKRMNLALSKYRSEKPLQIRNLARLNSKTPAGRARNTRLQAVRRARKASCPVSDEVETKFLYSLCQAISDGTGVPHHVDHIKPLSAGGAHTTSNLRIIPAVVNIKKGACIDGLRYIDEKNKKVTKRGGGY